MTNIINTIIIVIEGEKLLYNEDIAPTNRTTIEINYTNTT